MPQAQQSYATVCSLGFAALIAQLVGGVLGHNCAIHLAA